MAIKYSLPIPILFIMLMVSFTSAGQTDFRMRMGAGVEKELSKDLAVELEYEHRFDQFLTTFDKALIEPSIAYDLGKHWKLGLLYRLCYDQSIKRNAEWEHRIAASIRYDFDIDDIEIKLKSILQYGSDDLTSSPFSMQQNFINRNSIEIEYNWFGKRYTPYLKYEVFTHLNHPHGAINNQTRLSLGASYKLSKKIKIDLAYLFENEFNIVAPTDSHILSLGFSYRL